MRFAQSAKEAAGDADSLSKPMVSAGQGLSDLAKMAETTSTRFEQLTKQVTNTFFAGHSGLISAIQEVNPMMLLASVQLGKMVINTGASILELAGFRAAVAETTEAMVMQGAEGGLAGGLGAVGKASSGLAGKLVAFGAGLATALVLFDITKNATEAFLETDAGQAVIGTISPDPETGPVSDEARRMSASAAEANKVIAHFADAKRRGASPYPAPMTFDPAGPAITSAADVTSAGATNYQWPATAVENPQLDKSVDLLKLISDAVQQMANAPTPSNLGPRRSTLDVFTRNVARPDG